MIKYNISIIRIFILLNIILVFGFLLFMINLFDDLVWWIFEKL